MERKLKLIAEMGSGSNKAFLIEMPQDMVSGLKVYADGTIDTKCLLGMLMMMEQESALYKDEFSIGIPEQLDLMLNIYDPERAIDYKNQAI